MKFFTQLPIESTRLDDDDSVFEDAAQVLLTFPLILPLYNSSGCCSCCSVQKSWSSYAVYEKPACTVYVRFSYICVISKYDCWRFYHFLHRSRNADSEISLPSPTLWDRPREHCPHCLVELLSSDLAAHMSRFHWLNFWINVCGNITLFIPFKILRWDTILGHQNSPYDQFKWKKNI